jgi:hypothetical protein
MADDNVLPRKTRRRADRKVTPEADSMARGRARLLAAGMKPIDPWIPADIDALLTQIAAVRGSTKKAEAARLLSEAIKAYVVTNPLPSENQEPLFRIAS